MRDLDGFDHPDDGLTLAPCAVPAPAGARPLGEPPFWEPGTAITWRYRDHDWAPGQAETASPMRVVRDDERGLVAWLAPGTVHLTMRYADGGGLRDVPMDERFRHDHERVQARERWSGDGILRIAPAGRPWSVWLFWDGGLFEGWYVNLENAPLRSGTHTFTGDHVLDLWIEADGTVNVKDADELDAAVQQGRVGVAEAEQIRRNGDHGRASFDAGDWPFDEEWTRWRPDPMWATPTLGPHERWILDLT